MAASIELQITFAIIATLSITVICITNYVAKLVSTEVNKVPAGKDTSKQSKEALPSWKLTAAEVFEEPLCPSLLCAVLANGCQIWQILVPIAVIMNEMKTSESAGKLVAIVHLFFDVVAGYRSVLFLKALKSDRATSKGCIKVSLVTALVSFGTFFCLRNIMRYDTTTFLAEDTKSITLWLCFTMCFTLFGGYLATLGWFTEPQVLANGSTKTIGLENQLSWILVLVFGCLVSLFAIFEILIMVVVGITWGGDSISFDVLVLAEIILLVISGVYAWLVLHHLLLYSGKLGCWWWKTFLLYGGPVGLYMFVRPIIGQPGLNNSSTDDSLFVSFISGLFFMVLYGSFPVLHIRFQYRRSIAAAAAATKEPV